MISELIHGDCLEVMKNIPNDFYDLAICDIPYGIGVSSMAFLKEKNTLVKQKNGNKLSALKNKKTYGFKDWDNQAPSQYYFDELRRISKNQIIFGVEYVDWNGLGSGRIKWDKCIPDGLSFKKYEMAYCSLIDEEIEIKILWNGMRQAKSLSEPTIQQGNKKLNERRIHPCHKPVLLYKKLLTMFAPPIEEVSESGFKIIDTHLGGGANRIACYDYGIPHFTGIEIDQEYIEDHVEWFNQHVEISKTKIFK